MRGESYCGLAIVNYKAELRETAFETWGINRNGNHADASAREERHDDFESRGIDQQRPVAAFETYVAREILGQVARSLVQLAIGITLRLVSMDVEKDAIRLVRLDRRPVFEISDEGIHGSRDNPVNPLKTTRENIPITFSIMVGPVRGNDKLLTVTLEILK